MSTLASARIFWNVYFVFVQSQREIMEKMEHFLGYGYCDNDQLGGSYLAIMIVTIMGTVRAFCHDLSTSGHRNWTLNTLISILWY